MKIKNISKFLLSTAMVITMTTSSAFAMSDAEFNEKVRDFIMKNPSVIIAAVTKGQQVQANEEKMAKQQFILDNKDRILLDPDSPVIGPKDADVTIVEFFDYNCGACKMMYRGMEIMLLEDKNLRVVFKEFPIFGERSEILAKLSHAVYRMHPDKYFEYHGALMRFQGTITPEFAYQTAAGLGIQREDLVRESSKPSIEKAMLRDRELAKELGVKGTPNLIIGTEMIPSALDINDLRVYVKAAREAAKK